MKKSRSRKKTASVLEKRKGAKRGSVEKKGGRKNCGPAASSEKKKK